MGDQRGGGGRDKGKGITGFSSISWEARSVRRVRGKEKTAS